ncbi:Na+/H+ antiporter NhaC family protein [Anaeromicropila populeti]|uniref:Na+/H+ antiporter NhaC n=1 Tax=Anaeromicropila populeti TaxID=37658 RepID=A0A1I6KA46_9FIRM|nr:Na+/H+ antiporter NhaC family protein [Anaeromicropila populeti]SFR88076.1 Na+/H+ antiporter NhaC [Anaeromicropila populeti]
MTSGAISLCIPLLVILLAAYTKKIIPSLIIGILTGGIFLSKGNVINGTILAIEHLVNASASEESLYIIMFLYVFGAFGEIMKVSGGIKGFSKMADRYVKTEKGALTAIWAVSIFTFIDCCFHAISSGTIGKALNDKVNGNKYKLAHVVNVTSCLLIILIPFGTTYVGYIVGVIASSISRVDLTESAYGIYIKSIPFNFYPIVMLIMSISMIVFNFGFTKNVSTTNKKIQEETMHHGHEAHEQCEFEEKAPPRPFNLILPLILLIGLTFFLFWYTGKDYDSSFFSAIMNAEFEKSILVSGFITVVLTSVYYVFQKIPMREIESHFLSGGNEMVPPIIVLVLSWGLSSIVKDLGFIVFITNVVGNNIPTILIPAAIFLIGCAASYFMGSAWGTWALVMPIAVPLAVSTQLSVPLIVGAVLAGGSLGDNASPLGETAVLSATISEIPIMDHVKSQLPYSLTGVGISTVFFILTAIFA